MLELMLLVLQTSSNITDKEGQGIDGRPDVVLFRTEEEKQLFENK